MKTILHIRFFYGLWLTVLLLAGWAAAPARGQEALAAEPARETVQARLEDGGRTFALSAPGLTVFRAGFAAVVELDGAQRVLDSAAGVVAGVVPHANERTAYGAATGETVTIRFETEKIELLFRFDRIAGAPQVLLVQAGVRNRGERPVKLTALSPVTMDATAPVVRAGITRFLELSGNPAEWLVTGFHARTPEVRHLDGLQAPLVLHEQASVYRGDGAGFFIGPAGAPEAYLSLRVSGVEPGGAALSVSSAMDGVHVEPGEIRWGQQAALFFEPPRAALARWAEWVGRTHAARTAKGALSGWNNWNMLAKKEVDRELMEVADAVAGSDGHLRPGVIQMDYSYEWAEHNILDAPWLPECARRIAAVNARFGTHVGMAGPGWPGIRSRDEFLATVGNLAHNGFTYLKLYYPATRIHGDDRRTSFQVYRDDFSAIRRAAGEECYLLFCDYAPDRAVVGFVDASRIGPDAERGKIRRAIPSALRGYPLGGRWFAIDTDSYFIGTDIANISQMEGSWPLARTWISMTGLGCGTAITSDPWYWEAFKPYWRNVEVMTPPAKEHTEVLDCGTAAEWSRLVGHVRREWGDLTVALLWNPSEKEQAVTLDFARAGLDPQKRYAVWSFWDNRYLGVAEGSWTTPFLPPSASQHLRFTELPRGVNWPVLIGSNLHIYCGAAETRRVTALESAMQVELTDAGARAGDLFVYCRQRPELRRVAGCTVTAIAAAGENVWKISLADRRRDAAQLVELAIPLPVTRQAWFWLLCGLLLCALAAGVWRHLAGVRLRRERALERERVRIARDIHDQIGSTLTWIGQLAAERRDPVIEGAARGVVQAMDEIVWAVNPKNDTLDRLADYLVHYMEEFLRPAGIAYELDFPLDLPPCPLSAELRHNLFMAVREALNNAVKHGHPRRVRLGLALAGGRLTVTVRDDGCGFDPAAATGEGADGLANMRQRLAAIGGECRLESVPGRGTTVVLEVNV